MSVDFGQLMNILFHLGRRLDEMDRKIDLILAQSNADYMSGYRNNFTVGSVGGDGQYFEGTFGGSGVCSRYNDLNHTVSCLREQRQKGGTKWATQLSPKGWIRAKRVCRGREVPRISRSRTRWVRTHA